MNRQSGLFCSVAVTALVWLTSPAATAENQLNPVAPATATGNVVNPVKPGTGSGNVVTPVTSTTATGGRITLKPGQVKPAAPGVTSGPTTFHQGPSAGAVLAAKANQRKPPVASLIWNGGPTGRPECGGIVRGKPQKHCRMVPAKYIGKPTRSCPVGSFFDIGRWECWSCPAGFTRAASLDAVDSDRACLRPKKGTTKFAGAKFRGLVCPRGSFFDPIRGGECRACPTGYKRTIFHVDANNACQIGGVFGRVAPARHIKSATCAPGEVKDLLRNPTKGGECWRCPRGWARTVFPVNQGKACERSATFEYAGATKVKKVGCRQGQFWSPARAGSCWSCPASYVPTVGDLKSPACRARTIVWKTYSFPEPGLFGLRGGNEVALDLVTRKPQVIEAAILSVAARARIPLAQARREAWQQIATKPWASAVLNTAAFTRVLKALAAEKPTAAEIVLSRSFAKYMHKRQYFVAEDALAAYDAWDKANRYWKTRQDKSLAGLFYHGTVPPDFTSIVQAGTIGRLGASLATAGVITLTIANKAVFSKIFPHTLPALQRFATGAAIKAGLAPAEISAKATAAVASKFIGKGLLSFMKMGFTGPLLVATTVSAILAALAQIRFDAINDARPKLLSAVATARRPFKLPRLAESREGVQRLIVYWNLATMGKARPSRLVAARIAAAAVVKMAQAIAAGRRRR